MAPYVPLLLLFVVGAIITLAVFTLTSILGPKNPTPEKMIPYECGSETTGGRFVKPSVKFYLTAILFVVFDIETAFMYPWSVLFRRLSCDGELVGLACNGQVTFFGIGEMVTFLAVILVALAYVWRKRAIGWG